MNIKHPAAFVTGILALPSFAHAQTQAASEPGSSWGNLFWAILPIIIMIAIFIPLIRRTQKPVMKRAQEHRARQVQHMERVEESLDRIIKLLENRDR